MKKFLSLVLIAAMCAPAIAQKRGGMNRNAPAIKQSLTAGEATMSLDYTAITFASGGWMKELETPEGREGHNKQAAEKPLAMFKTSVDVTCGELQLVAGEYKVFFTLDEKNAWVINFQLGDKVQSMKLKLEDSGHESKRLLLCLYAEEKGAGVYVAFGKQTGMLSFAPAAKK